MTKFKYRIADIFDSPIEEKQTVVDFLKEKDKEGRLDFKSIIDIIYLLCELQEEKEK